MGWRGVLGILYSMYTHLQLKGSGGGGVEGGALGKPYIHTHTAEGGGGWGGGGCFRET